MSHETPAWIADAGADVAELEAEYSTQDGRKTYHREKHNLSRIKPRLTALAELKTRLEKINWL